MDYGHYFIHYNDIIEIHGKIFKCTEEKDNEHRISINKRGFLPILKSIRT
jgi:hypothetical protein